MSIIVDDGVVSRAEWLELRKSHLGASEAATILGVGYETPVDLWMRRTGRAPEVVETDAMRWGRLLEPLVLDEYERVTGRKVDARQRFVLHPTLAHLCATLDGVAGDVVVEAKTTRSRRWLSFDADSDGRADAEDAPHPAHVIQAHQQMMCCGLDVADIAVLIGGSTFAVHRVERNAELCDLIAEYTSDFWRCVERDQPPEWGRLNAKTLAVINRGCEGTTFVPTAIVDRWLTAQAIARSATIERDSLRDQILGLMGSAEYGETPEGLRIRRVRREVKAATIERKAYISHYLQILNHEARDER